ncbi:MAG: flagellar basal body rod protein FlgC [Clostridia bacterium]
MFDSLNISGSGLTAERFRMEVIAGNIANAQTTRSEDGGPYQRRTVVLSTGAPENGFFSLMERHLAATPVAGNRGASGGVSVSHLSRDPNPPKLDYDPDHPDSNEAGYVAYPNVDVLREMTDLMAANRGYQANASVFDVNKNMISSTLRLGR